MSLRHVSHLSLVSLSLLLALVGACGPIGAPAQAAGPGQGRETRTAQGIRCPDPDTSCTTSNGRGIYHFEDGDAWFDSQRRVLITHFTNTGKDVTFEGRYYDSTQDLWLNLPRSGQVTDAIFRGLQLGVLAMEEGAAGLVVTLYDPATGEPLVIQEDAVLDLTLRLVLALPSTDPMKYLLSFAAIDKEDGLFRYSLMWRYDAPGTVATSYCQAPGGKPDDAVFQQGIAVHPLNAQVTRDKTAADFLTLSCRGGAIATCKAWGYPHVSGSDKLDTLYDSCLQMKRASYCGDENGWTIAGTQIVVQDSEGINDNVIVPGYLEAHWSPKGATCLSALRQPTLNFPGSCEGVVLPQCGTGSNNPVDMVSGLPTK